MTYEEALDIGLGIVEPKIWQHGNDQTNTRKHRIFDNVHGIGVITDSKKA